MGTIGGNIANGSPIGDTPPPLIALGATLTLRKGAETRDLPLEDFFIDYGKQDRRPGEFVQSVTVPLPKPGAHYRVYKVTKRRDEDITAVLGAFHVEIEDGKVASAASPMAAWPRRRSGPRRSRPRWSAAWNEATVERAARKRWPGLLADLRHARLGRIPHAGRQESGAPLLPRDAGEDA
jgi:xanthine dehydrogenase small subunit